MNMKRASALAATSLSAAFLLNQADRRGKQFGLPDAFCEHTGIGQMSPEDKLRQWLISRGCQMQNVEIRPSKLGEQSGYGLFVAPDAPKMHSARRRWWWPFGAPPAFSTVAAFPLSSCLTAENILADPQVGGRLGHLVERGAMNERDIIIGHLAVEHARGAHSSLAPWIAMLPKELHSPLCWSPEELAELQGTPLHTATQLLKRKLANTWSEVQAVLQAVASQAGTERAPTWGDLLWAHCVYWSRGHSLPVPRKEGAASSLFVQDFTGAPQLMQVHEGVVPGLDFANHSSLPQCWWEVASHQRTCPPTLASSGRSNTTSIQGEGAQAGGKLASSVLLQLFRGASAGPGDELCINYGGTKSNEELLILYGFVFDPSLDASRAKDTPGHRRKPSLPGCSSADYSMLACPLAPANQWDELMHARMQLLKVQGLQPQFFLKASHITLPSSGKASAPVPLDVIETLEVFVLKPEEVGTRLEAVLLPKAAKEEMKQKGLEVQSCSSLDLDALSKRLEKKGPLPKQEVESLRKQLGLRMAAVSAFIGLLEVRMSQLESPPSGADAPSGTGSLEADLALLAQHQRAVEARKARSAAQSEQQEEGTEQALPHRLHCAVVYRAGQKQIARAYAVGAREELSRIMKLLEAVSSMS